jgi:hypothetical protein
MADDIIPTREQLDARMQALMKDTAWYARWRAGGADETREWTNLNAAIAAASAVSGRQQAIERRLALVSDPGFMARAAQGGQELELLHSLDAMILRPADRR